MHPPIHPKQKRFFIGVFLLASLIFASIIGFDYWKGEQTRKPNSESASHNSNATKSRADNNDFTLKNTRPRRRKRDE